jgi:hypothetical protein
MYFSLPVQQIGTISTELCERVNQRVSQWESNARYKFKYEDWQRLDSYNNPENFQLTDIVGEEICTHVMSYFPGQMLYGWSISYLPGKTKILDHVDRMLLHRFAKRIIVPLNNTSEVLNWHYSDDKDTKRYYTLDLGNIYRLNTAATHGLMNQSENPRRAIYFDVMDVRVYEKFKDHPDINQVILMKAAGVIHVL